MFEPAERLKNVKVSASAAMTRKVRELRAQGVKIVGLSSGEPDFMSPAMPSRRRYKAALAGETKYPPQDGTLALKKAVQKKFKRENGLDYALDEIMVSNGSKQIMFGATMASVNPGDEVIIPAPGWISYADQVKLCGGVPVSVSCPENNHFHLRAEDLDAAITPNTKWVVLNFPNNPTGAVCTREEMRELADVLPEASARAGDVGRDLRAPRL
jgi:aspartate aminotransferase